MADYHKMYLKLASVQADTIEHMQVILHKLITAQQEAEEIFCSTSEPDILLLPSLPDETEQ